MADPRWMSGEHSLQVSLLIRGEWQTKFMPLVPMIRLLLQLYSIACKLTQRLLLRPAARFSPLVAVPLLLPFVVLGAFVFVVASALKVNTATRASDSHPTARATAQASHPAVPASCATVTTPPHSATTSIGWLEWLVCSGLGHPAGPRKDLKRAFPPLASEPFGSRFWALLVANETYPGQKLDGPKNDADRVAQYLKEYLQVPSTNVVRLTDPHRKDLIAALYDLRDNKDIKPGDQILVFYSGHGTTYPLRLGAANEVTSISAICPVDRGSDILDISNRELNSIFSELCTAKGPNITIIFDCCFSGGALRSGDTAIRRIQPLVDRAEDMLAAGMGHPRRHSTIDIRSPSWVADATSSVHLAGCGRSEWAIEMPLKVNLDGGETRRHYGLFTAALLTVLESEKGKTATYEEVIQIIGRVGSQTPEALGTRKQSKLWFKDSDGGREKA